MGMLMKKIQRQLVYVVIKPPTGGPITGPSIAGAVRVFNAETNWCLGTVRKITIRPTGTIMAPPMPCRNRAATKLKKECVKPHSIEPSMKTPSEARNTVRAPKRSENQPEIGIKTARLIKYALNPSFNTTGSIPKSRAIIGNEVAMIVESITCTNRAQATIRGSRKVESKRCPEPIAFSSGKAEDAGSSACSLSSSSGP